MRSPFEGPQTPWKQITLEQALCGHFLPWSHGLIELSRHQARRLMNTFVLQQKTPVSISGFHEALAVLEMRLAVGGLRSEVLGEEKHLPPLLRGWKGQCPSPSRKGR